MIDRNKYNFQRLYKVTFNNEDEIILQLDQLHISNIESIFDNKIKKIEYIGETVTDLPTVLEFSENQIMTTGEFNKNHRMYHPELLNNILTPDKSNPESSIVQCTDDKETTVSDKEKEEKIRNILFEIINNSEE